MNAKLKENIRRVINELLLRGLVDPQCAHCKRRVQLYPSPCCLICGPLNPDTEVLYIARSAIRA